MEVAPLKEVLSYRNPFVIERFVEHFSVTEEAAEEIFQEMLKMLWLMASTQQEQESGPSVPKMIVVYREMNVIDEMWHAFILFSPAYTEFCRRYFGYYLHHLPTTSADRKKDREAFLADPDRQRSLKREQLRKQCVFIAERLGQETLRRWFKEYPARFPAFISRPTEAPAATAEQVG